MEKNYLVRAFDEKDPMPFDCFTEISNFLDVKNKINLVSSSKKTFFNYKEKGGVTNRNIKNPIDRNIIEIKTIQEEIKNCINIKTKVPNLNYFGSLMGNKELYFNDKLVNLINTTSEKQVDKAFNTLPKKTKQVISEITADPLCQKPPRLIKLKYFPVLKEYNYISKINISNNDIKEFSFERRESFRYFDLYASNNKIEKFSLGLKNFSKKYHINISNNYLNKETVNYLQKMENGDSLIIIGLKNQNKFKQKVKKFNKNLESFGQKFLKSFKKSKSSNSRGL